MEAKLDQCGEVVVVTLNGRLDIDMAKPFQEACLRNLLDKKVIFNLQSLCFVGSTGIQSFFQVLKEVHLKNKFGLRIAGMTADFQRLWSLGSDASLVIYENTQVAIKSFEAPVQGPESSLATMTEATTAVAMTASAAGSSDLRIS